MNTASNRSHARRTWIGVLLFLPLAAVILGTLACLPAPVGDPEKAVVDKDLVGAWEPVKEEGKDTTALVLMRAMDARTYYVQYMFREEKKEGEKVTEDLGMMNFRGWLTVIGGEQFICLQSLNNMDFLGFDDGAGEKPAAGAAPAGAVKVEVKQVTGADGKPIVIDMKGQKPAGPGETYYWAAQVKKEKDKLTLRPINASSAFLKDVTTRAELEAAIEKNLKSDDLYDQPMTFRKMGKEDVESIKTMMEKFHLGK